MILSAHPFFSCGGGEFRGICLSKVRICRDWTSPSTTYTLWGGPNIPVESLPLQWWGQPHLSGIQYIPTFHDSWEHIHPKAYKLSNNMGKGGGPVTIDLGYPLRTCITTFVVSKGLISPYPWPCFLRWWRLYSCAVGVNLLISIRSDGCHLLW